MRDLISDDRRSIIDVEDQDIQIDYEQFGTSLAWYDAFFVSYFCVFFFLQPLIVLLARMLLGAAL